MAKIWWASRRPGELNEKLEINFFNILSTSVLIAFVPYSSSGKTLAFILPAIVHILNQPKVDQYAGPTALVMAPTRELAQQIQTVANQFGISSGVRNACLFGGSAKMNQAADLRRGPQLVIATPGRLIDFLQTGEIQLARCTYLVLDEADRMLDMGFGMYRNMQMTLSKFQYIKPECFVIFRTPNSSNRQPNATRSSDIDVQCHMAERGARTGRRFPQGICAGERWFIGVERQSQYQANHQNLHRTQQRGRTATHPPNDSTGQQARGPENFNFHQHQTNGRQCCVLVEAQWNQCGLYSQR